MPSLFSNMTARSVAVILGAGPRVGADVSERFTANGYQVVTESRKGINSKDGNPHLSHKQTSHSPTESLCISDAVNAKFHTTPNVVVENAASLSPLSNKEWALSITSEHVAFDLNVNVVSQSCRSAPSSQSVEVTAEGVHEIIHLYGKYRERQRSTVVLDAGSRNGKGCICLLD